MPVRSKGVRKCVGRHVYVKLRIMSKIHIPSCLYYPIGYYTLNPLSDRWMSVVHSWNLVRLA
jgi:hypothetical protein